METYRQKEPHLHLFSVPPVRAALTSQVSVGTFPEAMWQRLFRLRDQGQRPRGPTVARATVNQAKA